LLVAFDLPTSAERDQLVKKAYEEHLLILKAGKQTVRFRPVLDVTEEAVDEGLARLESALGKL
ncbi:MAG: L-lysine 6-transaminase, partial [Planctomycetota bacterium]